MGVECKICKSKITGECFQLEEMYFCMACSEKIFKAQKVSMPPTIKSETKDILAAVNKFTSSLRKEIEDFSSYISLYDESPHKIEPPVDEHQRHENTVASEMADKIHSKPRKIEFDDCEKEDNYLYVTSHGFLLSCTKDEAEKRGFKSYTMPKEPNLDPEVKEALRDLDCLHEELKEISRIKEWPFPPEPIEIVDPARRYRVGEKFKLNGQVYIVKTVDNSPLLNPFGGDKCNPS